MSVLVLLQIRRKQETDGLETLLRLLLLLFGLGLGQGKVGLQQEDLGQVAIPHGLMQGSISRFSTFGKQQGGKSGGLKVVVIVTVTVNVMRRLLLLLLLLRLALALLLNSSSIRLGIRLGTRNFLIQLLASLQYGLTKGKIAGVLMMRISAVVIAVVAVVIVGITIMAMRRCSFGFDIRMAQDALNLTHVNVVGTVIVGTVGTVVGTVLALAFIFCACACA
jgi:hypothetical protein